MPTYTYYLSSVQSEGAQHEQQACMFCTHRNEAALCRLEALVFEARYLTLSAWRLVGRRRFYHYMCCNAHSLDRGEVKKILSSQGDTPICKQSRASSMNSSFGIAMDVTGLGH